MAATDCESGEIANVFPFTPSGVTGSALARIDFGDVKLFSFVGLIAGKQDALAVRKPVRPVVIDGVMREISAIVQRQSAAT